MMVGEQILSMERLLDIQRQLSLQILATAVPTPGSVLDGIDPDVIARLRQEAFLTEEFVRGPFIETWTRSGAIINNVAFSAGDSLTTMFDGLVTGSISAKEAMRNFALDFVRFANFVPPGLDNQAFPDEAGGHGLLRFDQSVTDRSLDART